MKLILTFTDTADNRASIKITADPPVDNQADEDDMTPAAIMQRRMLIQLIRSAQGEDADDDAETRYNEDTEDD